VDRGLAALGARPSAITFSETWRPDRLASASTVADLQYAATCRGWWLAPYPHA
jgi:hypothetical protein